MDTSLFFKFPGILILIGALLLIIAIIIGFLAYRKVDDDEMVYNEEITDDSIPVTEKKEIIEEENNSLNQPIILDDLNQKPEITEIPTEEVDTDSKNNTKETEHNIDKTIEIIPDSEEEIEQEPVVNDDNDFIIEDTVIKEEKETLDEETFNEMINKFNETIEDANDFIELHEEHQPIVEPYVEEEKEDLNSISLEKAKIEIPETEHKIYGGANPLDNVNLKFDDDVQKPLYGDENLVPNEPVVLETLNVKDEEEVEIL